MIRIRETIELLGYCSIFIAIGTIFYTLWLGGYEDNYVISYEPYTVFMLMVIIPGILNFFLTIVFIRPQAKIKNGVNLVLGALSILLLLIFVFAAV